METPVAEIMRKNFKSVKKSDPLEEAITLFLSNPEMVFPVVDRKGRVIGEINQHDVLKIAIPSRHMDEGRILGPRGIREALEHSARNVEDLMTYHNIKIPPATAVEQVAKIMLETDVGAIEVVGKRGELLGFVSELDVLRHIQRVLKGRKGKTRRK